MCSGSIPRVAPNEPTLNKEYTSEASLEMTHVYKPVPLAYDYLVVALKILPDAFADDPDRLARFQREAQVLASLNHPGMAQIYGIEEAEGTRALALELVEGETLADRIAQGPIPVDEALPIGTQIAAALEAAHEAGVIHRDLKPANIKVREDGTVKVLDFGLAKALEPAPQGDPDQSPTLTAAATQVGVIMGTAAYMSPEQARGKPVDKRTDIWAFGVVVYEMLTGRRAFSRDDTADTLAAVLSAEPDWDALPRATPARLRQVVIACLQRDRRQRLHDMADVRLTIDGRFESLVAAGSVTDVAPSPVFWQRPLLIALVALVLVTGLAWWVLGRLTPAAAPVSRFVVTTLQENSHGHALSPSGDRLVYSALGDGEQRLFVRFFDQIEAVPLQGTEGGTHPFFSPDGQSIGFSTQSELKRVPVDGGPPVTLCELDAHRGATWGRGRDHRVRATQYPQPPGFDAGVSGRGRAPADHESSAGRGATRMAAVLARWPVGVVHHWTGCSPEEQTRCAPLT